MKKDKEILEKTYEKPGVRGTNIWNYFFMEKK